MTGSGGSARPAREVFFRTTAAHLSVPLFVASPDGVCEHANDRWRELSGIELGGTWTAALHPGDAERVVGAWQVARERATELTVDCRLASGDSVAWVELHLSPLRDETGDVAGWVGTCIDRTAGHVAEETAAAASDRFRAAFDNAPIGMGLLTLDGRWLEVNSALCNLLEYTESELLAVNFDELRFPDSDQLEPSGQNASRPETRYRRSDGSAVWVSVSTTIVRDAERHPAYYIVQIEDVSDRKQAERELRRIADQDVLTGLLNRRGFLEGFRRELRRMQRTQTGGALLLLDLDKFKQVNDRVGHAAGDRVLRDLADALKHRLRITDVVGRLGGDEFAAVLIDVDETQAREIARELMQNLRTTAFAADGTALDVQASIGVVAIDGTAGKSDEVLLAEADRAMYDVKQLNRSALSS